MVKNPELETLMREIKGDRTFRQFSEDTGLSVATLSKYITGNGRGDIKQETLRKIVRPEAKPQGHVTLYDLMCASRLTEADTSNENDVRFEESYLIEEAAKRQENRSIMYSNMLKKNAFQQLKKMALAEIAERALSSRGTIVIDSSSLTEMPYAGEEIISLKVSGCGRVRDWYIYLILTDGKTMGIRRSLIVMGQLALEESRPSLKRSIFTNNVEIYKKLTDERDPFESSFKGDLSAILYDETSMKIAEEKYVSVFDDKSEMFSILSL